MDPGVRQAVRDFEDQPEHAQFPLAAYTQGRILKRKASELAKKIWNSDGAAISSSAGGSEAYLRLSWLIQDHFLSKQTTRPRVLMSLHEHEGARVPFTGNPSFEIRYIPDSLVYDALKTAELVTETKPHVILLSEILYDNCRRIAMRSLLDRLEERGYRGIFLLDAAQSAGNLDSLTDITKYSFPIFECFSLAKWLQGPWGTSATLCNQAALTWLKDHPRSPDACFDPESPTALLEPTGAQDFAKYAGIHSLFRRLLETTGEDRTSKEDRKNFEVRLGTLFEDAGIRMAISGEAVSRSFSMVFRSDSPDAWDPYPFYSKLNEAGIHIKCIKKSLADGTPFSALRWSLGRQLTSRDLTLALDAVTGLLKEGHNR